MGCVKSRQNDPSQNVNLAEKLEGKPGRIQVEKVLLVHSETGKVEDTLQIDLVLLEYAQRLSEEIIARAVHQWVEVDNRHSDIPYIECDMA